MSINQAYDPTQRALIRTAQSDFITNNGSAMCVTYDRDTKEFGFELMYENDGYRPSNAIGFQCTRGNLEVGFVDYNSPFYRK